MAQVLRHVPQIDDSRVLVDAATKDDAAVYQVTDNRAIVVSVDFFTPIVDDARSFGSIAAANAFSDIYAMGATPLFALNLVAWPRSPEMLELLGDTLDGALEIAQKAGAFVLGGHSIDDKEPKFGMVTVGEVEPDKVIDNAGARPGDKIVLTKPIGTGILATALKRDMVKEQDIAEAVESMSTLNAGAAKAMAAIGAGIHAATDVTGFGLLGHLGNLLSASGKSAQISLDNVPVFAGVKDLIQRGSVPGGTKANLSAIGDQTTWAEFITDTDKLLLCDAQTSGGLLIVVDESEVLNLRKELEKNNTLTAAIVGEITENEEALIEVTP